MASPTASYPSNSPVGIPTVTSAAVSRDVSKGGVRGSDTQGFKIVAIDDDPMTLRLVSRHLERAGYEVTSADDGITGLAEVNEATAIALVDLRMPEIDGFTVLRKLHEKWPSVQVIVLTGSDDVSDAVQAMREGAFQFLTKPFDPEQLLVFVDKAVQAWRVKDENKDLRESCSQNLPVRVVNATGDMHSRLMQQVDQIAALDSTVFVGGETGTGKSTIARMIHQKSRRAGGPFVTVNCASLPRDLIQSELFGHTKGAFTGAVKDRIGHAEMANGGTLFLDEIGELPIDLQPKLLTFLQDRTVQRLGSSSCKSVDVRLITATHRDLAELCREGLFRQDLYFRLLVLSLDLPALRHRHGEFPNIAQGILDSVCRRQAIKPKQFAAGAMELLTAHQWPGNIRELENVLERAVAFSRSQVIEPQDLVFSNVSLDRRTAKPLSVDRTDLDRRTNSPYQPTTPVQPPPDTIPQQVRTSQPETVVIAEPPMTSSPDPASSQSPAGYELVGKTLREIERDAILQTLEALGGNKARTARSLGISEKSIYNKMRRLEIRY